MNGWRDSPMAEHDFVLDLIGMTDDEWHAAADRAAKMSVADEAVVIGFLYQQADVFAQAADALTAYGASRRAAQQSDAQ